MDYFDKVRQFVIDSFEKSGSIQGLKHFDRTVYWIEQLKPGADEGLRIAAEAHDIERAYRDSSKEPVGESDKGFRDDYYLKYHPEKGAQIIGEFLEREGAPVGLIMRVKMLIEKHEVGGSDDQNQLKDADSISYLENQVSHFVEEKSKKAGLGKVKEKIDWMFDRITSEEAKKIARPMYEVAIEKLDIAKLRQ
jgi:Domain of unknown function (DUF4202)